MAERQEKSASGGELVFAALGGLGEVGMNCYLYGLGPASRRKWLMVDLGITFPEGEDDPGVDVIMPELKFIESQGRNLAGLVLTHAHEDHVGAVIELWPRLKCPIYATPFTAAMVKAKLAEFGNKSKMQIEVLPMGARFDVGPFDCQFITMSHSIPESSGLALRTPQGTVLHTGDWKLDSAPYVGSPADEAAIAALGKEGVLALVCDSTNAFRDGRSPSESVVAASIGKLIANAKQRVVVTCFSSNVARIMAVAEAAHAAGRRLVVAGRALHRVIQVAIDTGYLPPDFRYSDQQAFAHLPPSEVVALVTGSQGEQRAMMARMASGEAADMKLRPGDTVIFSSRTIPGNEKAIGVIQNGLARHGVEIITDSDALVHVTGHPRRDELRQMYAWVKPRIAVPMHGEVRHLKEHAKLARAADVPFVLTPVNGEMVLLSQTQPRIIDELPVGRLFRDGRLIIAEDEGAVRERRKLAVVGIIAISLVLSKRGEMLVEPELALDGVPEEMPSGLVDDIIFDAIEGTLKSIPPARRRDVETVREAVRRAVRSAVDNAWGKKPIVKVLVAVVDGKA